jgi:hypothetical protein
MIEKNAAIELLESLRLSIAKILSLRTSIARSFSPTSATKDRGQFNTAPLFTSSEAIAGVTRHSYMSYPCAKRDPARGGVRTPFGISDHLLVA